MSAGGHPTGHPTLLFLLLLYWSGYGYSDAKSSSSSSKCHSSCGSLPANISYPFRLKDDPKDCALNRFELACENNRTILYLLAGKYYVLDINYDHNIIRVVDVAIDQRNCFSLLLRHSLTLANLLSDGSSEYGFLSSDIVLLVNCERPIKGTDRNAMNYSIDLAAGSNSNCFNINYAPLRRNHSYMLGDYAMSDLAEMCTVEAVVPAAAEAFYDVWNLSLLDVMANGFDLEYKGWRWHCPTEGSYFHCLMEQNQIEFNFHWDLLIDGISFHKFKGYYSTGFLADGYFLGFKVYVYLPAPTNGPRLYPKIIGFSILGCILLPISIGYLLVARALIGLPLYLAFLVYKFRRRHEWMN